MSIFIRFVLLMLLLVNSGLISAQFSTAEYIDEHELEKKRIPRFRVDYGMQFLILNQPKNLITNDPMADHDWLFKSPAHQFAISILPGYRENWTLGTTVYFHRLLKEKEDLKDLLPADAFPYANAEDAIQFRRKVRIYGQSLLVERRLFSTPMEAFRLFARVEAGFSRYAAKAEIGQRAWQDSTYDFETYADTKETSFAFNGTCALGALYEKNYIGVSLLAGFRMETAHSFLPRNQFNTWKAVYYLPNYDGFPSDDEFGIARDNLPNNRYRFNQFYLQLTVSIFLGESWK